MELITADVVRDLIEEMSERLLKKGFDIHAEFPSHLDNLWIEINRFLLHVDICETLGDLPGIERNLEQVNRVLNTILEEIPD